MKTVNGASLKYTAQSGLSGFLDLPTAAKHDTVKTDDGAQWVMVFDQVDNILARIPKGHVVVQKLRVVAPASKDATS